MRDKHGLFFMDPNTPTPDPQQSTDGLIMPEQPAVTAEPTPAPAATSVPVATPAAAPVAETPVVPAPEVPVAPEAPAAIPTVPESDPLEAVAEPVAPTPAPPVTDQTMNKLDDSAKPIVAAGGQTVIAASKPHKSRRKTMITLVIGLILAGAAGFAAYTYFVKPNVAETSTPAAILDVDQLSPESLAQATDKGDLEASSQTNAKVLIFSGKAPADGPQGLVLQIEIQPLGTDFTDTPTEDTVAVPDNADPLTLKVADYPAGSYHWQARLSDGVSSGPWVAYNSGDDAGKTADFTIDTTAPAAALIKTVNAKTVSTKNITSTVGQPVITGTSEAGSTVTVALSETLSYKAVVAADGSWTLTADAAVPNGKYTLTVTATDAAGNATAATYNLTQAAN